MNSVVQVLSIAVSALLLLLVLELVRRRKLTEEHSFIWIVCSVVLLVFSTWRDLLHIAAQWMGIFYPPMVLLLVLIFFVFVALLYFSVVISTQREQIEHLVVEVALLTERLRQTDVGLRRRVDAPDNDPAVTATDGLPPGIPGTSGSDE